MNTWANKTEEEEENDTEREKLSEASEQAGKSIASGGQKLAAKGKTKTTWRKIECGRGRRRRRNENGNKKLEKVYVQQQQQHNRVGIIFMIVIVWHIYVCCMNMCLSIHVVFAPVLPSHSHLFLALCCSCSRSVIVRRWNFYVFM